MRVCVCVCVCVCVSLTAHKRWESDPLVSGSDSVVWCQEWKRCFYLVTYGTCIIIVKHLHLQLHKSNMKWTLNNEGQQSCWYLESTEVAKRSKKNGKFRRKDGHRNFSGFREFHRSITSWLVNRSVSLGHQWLVPYNPLLILAMYRRLKSLTRVTSNLTLVMPLTGSGFF